MAKIYLTEAIAVLVLPFYVAAQRYILESEPSYLSEVNCPVTVNITCRADRVLVLRWIAEQDGTLVEFASHSGNVNDVYQINKPDWTSIEYAQPAIMAYANSEFDINATISIPLSYMIDESISRIFCGSSATSKSESFMANTTIIGPPPPPQFNRCCTGKPVDPMGFITCNHTSPNETYLNFPLLPNVDMYTVNYEEQLLSTDCLHNQFVSPNMRCKFMQQNESTEYSFSIRTVNCNNQESQASNFTLITGPEAPQDIIISRNYVGDLSYSVAWKVSNSECPGIPYTFVVELQNETGQVLESRDVTCMTKDCSVQIQVPPTDEKYRIRVSATDNQGNPLLGTSKTSQLLDGFSSNVKFLPCYTSVMCISRLTGRCEIYITQGSRNITSGTGSVNSSISFSGLNLNTEYFYIANITTTESISLLGDNFTTIEYDARLSEVHFAFIALGVIFLLASIGVIILCPIVVKLKQKKWSNLFITVWLCGIVAVIVDIILWIIFWAVVFSQDNTCDSTWQSARDGLIAFSVLGSFVSVLISIIFLFIIVFDKTDTYERTQKTEDQTMLETFAVDLLSEKIDDKGRADIEQNVAIASHKRIGESTQAGNLRVKEHLSTAIIKGKENEPPLYSKTEHVGPASNHNKTPKPGSNTSSWLGRNSAVTPGDMHYAPLQHNSAGPSGPPSVNTSTSIATGGDMSQNTAAGYGQLDTKRGPSNPSPKVGSTNTKEVSTDSKLEDQDETSNSSTQRIGGKKAEKTKQKEENVGTKET